MSTQAIAINAGARQRYLLLLLFAGFVLTGLEITVAAPLLPEFIARWGLSDAKAGSFSTLQFGFSLAGVWLSSLLTHYFGNRASLILGYLAIGVGLATVNSSTISVTMFGLAALGTGYGLVVPGTNLTVAEIGGARSASLVSLVNFAWGAGSFSCPMLILIAQKSGLLMKMLYFFGGFGFLLAISFLFAEFPETKHATKDVAPVERGERAEESKVRPIVVLAVLFFLYVAIEVSFGFWAAAHVSRFSAKASGLATLAPSFFYGGLTAGRALAPIALARVREYRLVMSTLAVVIVAGAFFVFSTSQWPAFVSAAITGLGCASIFPIYIAWLSRWFGPRATRLRGIMFSMSSIGSFTVPGLVGFVSAHAGGLRVGLLLPLAAAFIMMFLLTSVRRQATA